MAIGNSTGSSFKIEYTHCSWGELICGTQEQLQSIGIGKDESFPDTKRKKVTCVDPRGFPVEIKLYSNKGDGIYSAKIALPGREPSFSVEQWVPFSPGVKMRASWHRNVYRGTEFALCAAGLVQSHQLPGKPGNNKCAVTIYPANNASSSKEGSKKRGKPEGTICIKKISESLYEVDVVISDEESARRNGKHNAETQAWERHVDSLPRPRPLLKDEVKKGECYSSLESFKEFAIHWISSGRDSFRAMFSGEIERREYGEVTIKLDERSLREIEDAYAALVTAVTTAKVCKVPQLRLVK